MLNVNLLFAQWAVKLETVASEDSPPIYDLVFEGEIIDQGTTTASNYSITSSTLGLEVNGSSVSVGSEISDPTQLYLKGGFSISSSLKFLFSCGPQNHTGYTSSKAINTSLNPSLTKTVTQSATGSLTKLYKAAEFCDFNTGPKEELTVGFFGKLTATFWVEPTESFEGEIDLPIGDQCWNSQFGVEFTGSDAYDQYLTWEVQDVDGSWIEFASGMANPSLDLSEEGTLRQNNTLVEEGDIDIRVYVPNNVGSFGMGTQTISLKKPLPKLKSVTTIAPECKGGTNGEIHIEFESPFPSNFEVTGFVLRPTKSLCDYFSEIAKSPNPNDPDPQNLSSVLVAGQVYNLTENGLKNSSSIVLKGDETQILTHLESYETLEIGEGEFTILYESSNPAYCFEKGSCSDGEYTGGYYIQESIEINTIDYHQELKTGIDELEVSLSSIAPNCLNVTDNSVELTTNYDSEYFTLVFNELSSTEYKLISIETLSSFTADESNYKATINGNSTLGFFETEESYLAILIDKCVYINIPKDSEGNVFTLNQVYDPTELTYLANLSDAIGKTEVITLTESTSTPSITLNDLTNVACYGGNNGEYKFNLVNFLGNPSYQLYKDNAKVTKTVSFSSGLGQITGLEVGNYTIVVRDDCQSDVGFPNTFTETEGLVSLSFSITEPSSPLSVKFEGRDYTSTSNDINKKVCIGESYTFGYSINANGSGGTSGVSVEVNDEAYTEGNISLSAGENTVIFTSNSCSSSITFNIAITEYTAPSLTLTPIDVQGCFGGNNGAIEIALEVDEDDPGTYSYKLDGTTPSYEFTDNSISDQKKAWTARLTEFSSGTFTVNATGGCISSSLSESATINEPVQLSITNLSSSDPTIVGGNNGQITFMVNGEGEDNGSGVNRIISFTSLPNGFGIVHDSGNSYKLDPLSSNTTIELSDNSSKIITVTDLVPHTYTFHLYSASLSDCKTDSKSLTVLENSNEPTLSVAGTTREILNEIVTTHVDGRKDVSKFGEKAEIKFTMSTVTLPATFELRQLDSHDEESVIRSIDVDNLSEVITFSDIIPGQENKYRIYVKESVGQVDYDGYRLLPLTDASDDTFYLTQPDEIVITTTITTVAEDINTNPSTKYQIKCNGGVADPVKISVEGGEAPFNITITKSNDIAYNFTQTGVAEESEIQLSSLTEGTYTISVTDYNSINKQIDFTLEAPDQLDITYSHTDATCFNRNNASISISGVTGGIAPYTVELYKNGSYNQKIENLASSSATLFEGLYSGNYTVKVIDSESCSISTNTITLGQPTNPISVSLIESVKPACFNENTGAIKLNVTGGTPSADGNYNVYIFDENGERVFDETTIYTLNPSDQFVKDTDGNSLIFDSDQYKIVVTDEYNCSCEEAIDENSQNLTLRDNSSLIIGETVAEFDYEVDAFPAIQLNASTITPSCRDASNGKIVLNNITGGNLVHSNAYRVIVYRNNSDVPLNFNLIDGEYVYDASSSAAAIAYVNGSLNITGLEQGTYQLEIGYMLENGEFCFQPSESVTINQAPIVTLTQESYMLTDVSICHGQNNGQIDYSIRSSLADNRNLIFELIKNEEVIRTIDDKVNDTTNPIQVSFQNLGEGSYTVKVYLECFSVLIEETLTSSTFQISEPSELILTEVLAQHREVSLKNARDGVMELSISGDGDPTEGRVLWIDDLEEGYGFELVSSNTYRLTEAGADSIYISNNSELIIRIEELYEGSYNVMLASATTLSCSTSVTVNIDAPNQPSMSFEASSTRVALDQILTTRPTYGYEDYDVVEPGDLGSIRFKMGTVITPAQLELRSASDTSYTLLSAISDSVTVSGIDPGVAYELFVRENSDVETLNYDGFRLLPIEEEVSSFELREPAPLAIVVDSLTTDSQLAISCFEGLADSIAVEVSGGVPPYTVEVFSDEITVGLSNVQSDTFILNQLTEDTYSVQITDANGYDSTFTHAFEINDPDQIELFYSLREVNCNGDANGIVYIDSIKGGTKPYTINLRKDGNIVSSRTNNNGNAIAQFSGLISGSYQIEIIDAAACTTFLVNGEQSTSYEVEILQPKKLKVVLLESIKPECLGEFTGGIRLKVEGGRPWNGREYKVYSSLVEDTSLPNQYYTVDTLTYNVVDGEGDHLVFDSLEYYLTVTDSLACPCEIVDKENAYPNEVVLDNRTSDHLFEFAYKVASYPRISLSTSQDGPFCYGANDGVFHIRNISGGSPSIVGDYTISIRSGTDTLTFSENPDGSYVYDSNATTTLLNYSDSLDLSGFVAGDYQFDVYYDISEDQLCKDDSVFSFRFEGPEPITRMNENFGAPICNDGYDATYTINLNGGRSEDYQILLSEQEFDGNKSNFNWTDLTISDSILIDFSYQRVSEDFKVYASWNDSNSLKIYGLKGGEDFNFYVRDRIYFDQNNEDKAEYNLGSCEELFEFTTENANEIAYQLTDKEDLSCYEGGDGQLGFEIIGGDNDRLYTITLSNNSQDYQFVDIPLNTKVIFTDLAAGKYTVLIEDSLGCSVSSNDIQLSQPNLNRIVEIRSQLQACDIYTLEVRMDGNPSNYDFEVSTTPDFEIENTSSYTSHLIENIGVGDYWVRAINTENGSCFVEDSISLLAQSFVISSVEGESMDDVQQIQLSCFGDLTDVHLEVVEGNVGQVEYAMFEDADGNNIIESWTLTNSFELGEGTYYFRAKDSFDCLSEVFELQITAPEQLIVDHIVIEDAACSNAANGVLSFNLTGGVSPYLIQIGDLSFNVNEDDLIANTFTIYNLEEGIHTLRVVDDSLCSISQEVTVETTDELSINLLEVTPDYCQFNNGGGKLGVEGNLSTINWSYQLDQIGAQKNSLFVDLECNFDGLAAGDYIFFAEDDSTTCSVSLLVSIPSEDAFSFSFTPIDLAACGEANGTGVIEVISSDVIENSYEIIDLDESLSLDSANSTLGLFYISGLSAGVNYPITINAESNCSVAQYISIGSIDGPSLFDSSLVSSPTCELSNGTYSISFTGGSAPYQITSLSNGASISKASEIVSEESVLISKLGAGTHYVSFSDSRGCSNTLSFTIESVREEFGSHTFEKTPSHCGQADGSIVFLPDNAEDYTASEYVWYSEEWQQIALGSSISDISAGVYYLEIRRADSCGDTLQVSLADSEVQPQITNVETTVSACNKAIGTAKVSSTLNVTTALAYVWFNLNGDEIAETQVDSLTSLSAGEYSVKLLDQNGCESERFYFSITEMEAMEVVSVSLKDVSCNGGNDGSISVDITKGLAPYRYSWDGGAFVEGLSTKENLAAETHSLQVLDANNCLFEITTASNILVINEPNILSVFAESQDLSCFGGENGQATLSYFGGTPPYAFKWYNESLETIATTEQVNDLAVGKYFIEIQDANNCLALDSIELIAPDSLELTLVAVLSPSCTEGSDATASVQVSGGTLPYTYLWDNGETTLLADSLTSGIHSVTVMDAMRCSKTLEVSIPERSPITYDYEVTDPLCEGDNNGTLTLNISGGAGEYFVDWGNEVIGTTRTGLGLGSYTFTITDKNGCQLTDAVTIGNQPTSLVATLDSVTALSCYGGADAAIKIAIEGGTAPYQVSWSNNKRGTNISGLTSGTYIATVTDSQNCQTTLSVVVAEPEGITIVIPDSLKQQPSCYGGTDGMITPLVSGGEKPYTFTWSNASKDSIATQLISGVYSLTVQDVNGCSSFFSNIKLGEPEQIVLALDSLQEPLCVGASNGEIYLSASGGDGQYEFVWEDSLIASSRTDLSAGKYVVTVYDGEGCSDELIVRLTDPEPLNLSISPTMPICFESCSGQAEAVVTGGTAPYTYTWSSGSKTQQATDLCEGTYTLIVQDANGCEVEGSVTLIDPAPLEITEIELEYTLCEGQELVLNPDGYASYQWTSVNGLDYYNSEIVLTEAGTYTLNVSSEDGCLAEKSFTLNYLENTLETDFVISSEAVVGDTVVFVDVTWPRTDNVTWSYPESDKVEILETDSIHRQEVIFSEEGSYEFTMYVASELGCVDSVTKWVEVVASSDIETNTRKQENDSNIINIQAKPNPVSNLLSVKVDLEKAEPVRLILRGMLGRVYFEYLENSGSTQVSTEWDVSQLPTGMYIIEIISVTERSSRKVSKY
ncbi:T9SS type A sorting domain-containing protein [Sediminitomix flava]|nr:T9SS type A sorting domain-containing protein [Sediminitomix flava]